MRFQLTPVVKQLLIANVVFYIGALLLQERNIFDLASAMALHYPMSPEFRPWQIISHMFMHSTGSIFHLLFNMFGLVSIGCFLENYIGQKKFLQLYFISGLGAAFIHFGIQIVELYNITGIFMPSVDQLPITFHGDRYSYYTEQISSENAKTVASAFLGAIMGASGALYGVVAAFAFYFPNTQLMVMFIPYPIKAKILVPIFLALDLFLGISNYSWDNIAHYAHLGGALFGLLLVWYWRKFDKRNFW